MGLDADIRKKSGRARHSAEINVTPLVDVMLVLLIIFMITAPMMTRGVKVELPETTAKPLPQKTRPITITINKKGVIYLNAVKIDLSALRARLSLLKRRDPKVKVILRGDKDVPYGIVASVITALKEADIKELGLITRFPER